jgi:hypothetical protein
LDVAVFDDLPVVPPRIEEIQASIGRAALYLGVRTFECAAHCLPVVYDQTNVPMLVRALRSAFGQGEKLIPGVNERSTRPTPTQLQLEKLPVELQSFFDIADLQGHVVET